MKILFTLSLALLLIQPVCAETEPPVEEKEQIKEYDVELIIFEDAHARYINNEAWPADIDDSTSMKTSGSGISVFKNVSSAADRDAFTEIKPSLLNSQYSSLKRSSEYNILFRGAWRQQGLGEEEAFSIDLAELTNRHRSTSENSIDGKVKVVLARYLHFHSDMLYQRQPPSDTPVNKLEAGNESPQVEMDEESEMSVGIYQFAIESHRKMRSKELHYIDHPLVGILIRIDPVEADEETEAS